MYFRRRISKFLAAMTIGSCVVPSFNSFVLGMENKGKFSEDISDKIFEQIKESANKSIEYRLLSYIFENLHMILYLILTTDQISFYKEGMDFAKFLSNLENWIESPSYDNIDGDSKFLSGELQGELVSDSMWLLNLCKEKLMNCSLGNNTRQRCIRLIFELISHNINNNKITRENVEILDNVITILSKRCRDFFNEKIKIECPICSSDIKRGYFIAPCCNVRYHLECWEKWTNLTKPCCPCCDHTAFV